MYNIHWLVHLLETVRTECSEIDETIFNLCQEMKYLPNIISAIKKIDELSFISISDSDDHLESVDMYKKSKIQRYHKRFQFNTYVILISIIQIIKQLISVFLFTYYWTIYLIVVVLIWYL